jgi:hypothetical protein
MKMFGWPDRFSCTASATKCTVLWIPRHPMKNSGEIHLGDILNGREDRPSVLCYRHVEWFRISEQGCRIALPHCSYTNRRPTAYNLIYPYSFNPLSMYTTQSIYLSTFSPLFLSICRPSFLPCNFLSLHSLSFTSAKICPAVSVLLHSYKAVPVAARSKA